MKLMPGGSRGEDAIWQAYSDYSDLSAPTSSPARVARSGRSVQEPAAARSQILWLSRRPFGQEVPEGLFALFDCFCHAFKTDGRALYWRRPTGTINLPPPGLSWPSSSLHGERIVGWIKFSPHHALERKRGSTWMICLHREQPLIPVSIIVFIRGAV